MPEMTAALGLRMLLAGLGAGVVAITATRLIERLGSRLGGVLGTAPSTIVPAGIGLAAAGREGLDAALGAVPVGMWVNAVFLWSWRWLPRAVSAAPPALQLPLTIAASLLLWAIVARAALSGLDQARAAGAPPLLLGGLAWLASLAVGALSARGAGPPRGPTRPVGPLTLIARGLLAAAAIAGALGAGAAFGPEAAGLAAVFPAIFLTTMVSLWMSQGQAVSGAAVGPMMLGSASVGAYALIAAHSLPALGPALGSICAWLGAVCGVTLPAAWALTRPAAPR